jgi:hypothetical protein
MANAFSGQWAWFGFEGEPEPGIDYSWMEVQNKLNFIGYESAIVSCSLYFSSRKAATCLVRTQKHEETIWNITDCTFVISPYNPSILIVSYGQRKFHLSGVASAFIELLMRSRRLPLDSLQNGLGPQPCRLNIIRSTAMEMPEEATGTNSLEPEMAVIVTGTDFSGELTGIPAIGDAGIILQKSDAWHLNWEEIQKVNVTTVGSFYLLIETVDARKYEIRFHEGNAEYGEVFYQELKKVLDSRSQ